MREITGRLLPIVTDGGDQAVVELEALIAPCVVAFADGPGAHFAGCA